MNRRALRSTAVWAILAAVGCSGGTSGSSGCGGCGGSGGCTAAIPGGFPTNERIPNAISAQLSAQGLQYFEQNLTSLIGALTGMSNGLDVAVPCIMDSQSISVFGTVTVNVCCGPSCNVMAGINSLTIAPMTAADGSLNVTVTLSMSINTGQIPVAVPVSIFGIGICTISCDIGYDETNLPLAVTLNLKVDPNWGNILAANVSGLDVSSIVNAGDLNIGSGGGFCSGVACGALDLSFVKSEIVSLLTPTLQSTVQTEIDKIRCQACDTTQFTGNGGCPTSTASPPSSVVASCDSSTKLCYISKSADTCAPAQLGLQGAVDIGTTLATFGAPANATLDLYAVAGGEDVNGKPTTYEDSSGGIVVGVMGGTDSQTATCIPSVAPPVLTPPTGIDFIAAASETGLPTIATYQIGIAIADEFINKALYDTFNSGALCLNVGSSLTSLLSTALFQSTFLLSLNYLTHGENKPMMVVLRPKTPPSVEIGLGTDTSPLLSITMKQLQLDFYANIEDRPVRLFSLTTDIVGLPIGLTFDPAKSTVTPSIGTPSTGLAAAFQNPTVSNSEMLADTDSAALGMILQTLIGVVQGPLNSALQKPISLPTFSGLALGVESARGAVPASSGTGYQQLALFASLGPAMMETGQVHTDAQLVQGVVPTKAQIIGPEHLQPYAIVQASGSSPRTAAFSGYEYKYAVDGGPWSLWTQSTPFEVHDPVLLLQSKHQISVKAREIGVPLSEDLNSATVEFDVDYEPPKVQFQVDTSTTPARLLTIASDTVWNNQLTYQYSFDGAPFPSPGPIQAFTLEDMKNHQSLAVQVTDGAGLTAKATYGAPRMPSGPAGATSLATGDSVSSAAGKARATGCAQGGVPGAALALLGFLLARRRRNA